jgi:hypothetical protein
MFFRAGGSDKRVRAGGVWVCVVWSERNGKNGKNGMSARKLLIHKALAFSVFYSVFRSVFRSVCGCDRWRVLCGAGAKRINQARG